MMIMSKYNSHIQLNEKYEMLYNLISREYYVYDINEEDKLRKLLEEINKSNYTTEEVALIKSLYKKGIIIDESIDELKKLERYENEELYDNKKFYLTIYATNACNFRCSYCTQEHVIRNLEIDVQQKIVETIEIISSRVRDLYVTWFGGEPTLQHLIIYETMKKASKICEKNKCNIHVNMVTNGYLLTEEMLMQLKEVNIESMQITVDGDSRIHDKRRVLPNGEGTYEQIVANINKALDIGIKIVLRINVDEESFKYPISVLDDIEANKRRNVKVSISNLFQEKGKNSTYSIWHKAISMGYQYGERYNNYRGCTTCGKNSLVIDTNGNILFCTSTDNSEKIVGYLGANGHVRYNNLEKYNQELLCSIRDNTKCHNCKELPLCIGRCKLSVIKNGQSCIGNHNDGLTIEERAKLDLYYDYVNERNY